LNNNDINATAVCIEVTSGETVSAVFKAHRSFWDFVLSGTERQLKAVKAGVDVKTFVRLAFKSFELGIQFSEKDPSGKAIDLYSEVLYKSHVEKIEKMSKWDSSPFLRMKIEKKSRGYMLKPLATKVDCSACVTGRANKNCKKKLCKKCCLLDTSESKCTAHGKKPGTVTDTGEV